MRKFLGLCGGSHQGLLASTTLLLSMGSLVIGRAQCIPSIASVTPNIWNAGQTYNVSIAGSNFIPSGAPPDAACASNQTYIYTGTGLAITVGVGTVQVSNINVVSTTQITATVAVAASDPTESACIQVGTLFLLGGPMQPAADTAASSSCVPLGSFYAVATAQIVGGLSATITDASNIMNGIVTVDLSAPTGTVGDLNLVVNGSDSTGQELSQVLFNALAPGSQDLNLTFDTVLPGIYTVANGDWNPVVPPSSSPQQVTIPDYTLQPWTYFRRVRFSQYNTPDENATRAAACTGHQANAWIVTAVATTNAQGRTRYKCSFDPITLNSEFIQQTWINGTGLSRQYGLLQNAAAVHLGDLQRCRGQYPPGAVGNNGADYDGNAFVQTTSVVPSCTGMQLEDGSAAMPVDKFTMNPTNLSRVIPLKCGFQLNLDAGGYQTAYSRTIVDKCPKCSDPDSWGSADGHVDSYTTDSACRRDFFKDLGNRNFFYTSNVTN